MPRIALSIRAQLLLVLTVFLRALAGYEYVRELELCCAMRRSVSLARHRRRKPPRCTTGSIVRHAAGSDRFASRAMRCDGPERYVAAAVRLARRSRRSSRALAHDGAHLGDRPRRGRAQRGGIFRAAGLPPAGSRGRATMGRFYPLVLAQPREDFSDDALRRVRRADATSEGRCPGSSRRTGARRRTARPHPSERSASGVGGRRGTRRRDRRADRQRGPAERNRAFERLFNIVLAVLLVGSFALTAYATWSRRASGVCATTPSARDRRGGLPARRSRVPDARDEIGDLHEASATCWRGSPEHAAYQEKMASRLSHELRTPIAVVRLVARQPARATAAARRRA